MGDYFSVSEFCRIKYSDKLRDGKPTKAQENTVRKMCADGKFARAFKIGRSWLIDLSAETGTDSKESW